MSSSSRFRFLPGAATLALGIALGWAFANVPRGAVRASSGDRSGESILASGPVQVGYKDGQRVQISQDALYYLDYKTGRLLATIPSFQQSLGSAKLVDTFAERDLVADFKLDLERGPRPRFLMTTGALGIYGDGCSPLFVLESTTNQVAVYKVQQQTIGRVSQPRFDLIEVRPIARAATAAAER